MKNLYRWGMAWPLRKTGIFFGDPYSTVVRHRWLCLWDYFVIHGDPWRPAMLLLHQHGRKKDVLPHDGGDIVLPGWRSGLIVQLAQDKEDGDR